MLELATNSLTELYASATAAAETYNGQMPGATQGTTNTGARANLQPLIMPGQSGAGKADAGGGGIIDKIVRNPIKVFGGFALLAFCCGGLMYLICKARLFYTKDGLRHQQSDSTPDMTPQHASSASVSASDDHHRDRRGGGRSQ